eukprot:SAG11_NODE_32020_length_287_cov_0.696809_1_plen_48_part_10
MSSTRYFFFTVGVTFQVFERKLPVLQDLLPGLGDRAHRLQLFPKWKID